MLTDIVLLLVGVLIGTSIPQKDTNWSYEVSVFLKGWLITKFQAAVSYLRGIFKSKQSTETPKASPTVPAAQPAADIKK